MRSPRSSTTRPSRIAIWRTSSRGPISQRAASSWGRRPFGKRIAPGAARSRFAAKRRSWKIAAATKSSLRKFHTKFTRAASLRLSPKRMPKSASRASPRCTTSLTARACGSSSSCTKRQRRRSYSTSSTSTRRCSRASVSTCWRSCPWGRRVPMVPSPSNRKCSRSSNCSNITSCIARTSLRSARSTICAKPKSARICWKATGSRSTTSTKSSRSCAAARPLTRPG